MNPWLKTVIIALLAITVGAVMVLKEPARNRAEKVASLSRPTQGSAAATTKAALPRLVDLGAGKCIPCKLMAPILEQLKHEYSGRLDVQFIDVWENPDAGKQYSIEVIPTQIFYDVGGKELFRHVGFLGKEDILTQWKTLGIELGPGTAPATAPSNSVPTPASNEEP